MLDTLSNVKEYNIETIFLHNIMKLFLYERIFFTKQNILVIVLPKQAAFAEHKYNVFNFLLNDTIFDIALYYSSPDTIYEEVYKAM